ncbi:reverse transcriptase-like protein [Phycisphaerales bacterium AB-hyl4]|uniref:Reverse transcriptase-like protein n=1 Tax=Natronomicrosphaera hydrolytica TaxID=3242702 RepID=A0ABV4U775_9BACT
MNRNKYAKVVGDVRKQRRKGGWRQATAKSKDLNQDRKPLWISRSSPSVQPSNLYEIYVSGVSQREWCSRAAVAWGLKDPNESGQLHVDSCGVAKATCITAEYEALCKGLEVCRTQGIREVMMYTMAQTVMYQLYQKYAIRKKRLYKYALRFDELANQFDTVSINHASYSDQNMKDVCDDAYAFIDALT